MARGTPIYDSGQISAGGGSQAAFIAKIVEKLTEYQSNGEQAWELADQIEVGSDYEAVFHSVGDRSLGSGSNKGDTDIWVYFHRFNTDDYTCAIAQDYSPTTGVWVGGALYPAGTGTFMTSLSDTASIDWYSVCNEYEFVFVWLVSGSWGMLHFGQPIKPYDAEISGVARITSQSGTGNGVVFGLDRDISSGIQVGQPVWLVNQTPDSTSLQSVSVDLVIVAGVSSNSITVDGVVNTYAVGSLVGLDPIPSFVRLSASGSGNYFVTKLDGSYSTAIGQTATAINLGTSLIAEGDYDPDVNNFYLGLPIPLKMSVAPQGMRGTLQLMRVFTRGLQIDADVMKINFDTNNQWKAFVTSGATLFSSWTTGIGPGAT